MSSDAVKIVKGTPRTFWSFSDTGNHIARLFCESCGTPLFAHSPARPDIMAIKVGSLDDPSWFRRARRIDPPGRSSIASQTSQGLRSVRAEVTELLCSGGRGPDDPRDDP